MKSPHRSDTSSQGVLFDQLESRTLLAFAISDYQPLGGGHTWNFSGTSGGRTSTSVMTSGTGFFEGGVITTRLRTQVNDPLGVIVESRYFAIDQTGFRWFRRDRSEGGSSQTDRTSGGVRLLPRKFDVGQSFPYSGPYSSVGGGATASGSISGSVSVIAEEDVATPAGIIRAIKIQRTAQGQVSLTSGGQGGATFQTFETQWWAKGVGLVKLDYSQDEQYSDGSQRIENFNVALTSSSLLTGLTGFRISGNGVAISRNDTTPNAADGTVFGRADINTGQSLRTFIITNSSPGTMTIDNVSMSDGQIGDFAVVQAPARTIGPGQTTALVVRFDPSAVGVRSARITIASSDPLASPFSFRIRGTGTLPGAISVRASGATQQIVSGGTTVSSVTGTRLGRVTSLGNTSVERSFFILNTGLGALNVNGVPRVRLSGPAAIDFAVSTSPTRTIAPGSQSVFTIRFDPSVVGARRATVEILSDDPNRPVFSFVIVGTGI